ncbi:MAG: hypothetical protein KGL45_03845 [Gammaproteobacteria bacterium]|nr:hypothetical protein [Gammaproteobacteria bacterium]MDE2261634.1 hypothetical protein [Gammaproteobacteria bacterium]
MRRYLTSVWALALAIALVALIVAGGLLGGFRSRSRAGRRLHGRRWLSRTVDLERIRREYHAAKHTPGS